MKTKPQPSVIRLIIEQDNGKVQYLEGEAAQKYVKQIDDALVFKQATRRYLLPEDFLQSSWQEINVREASKLFQKESKPKS